MKKILSVALACLMPVLAHAQIDLTKDVKGKLDLGARAQGQLPAANAAPVLGSANRIASMVGSSMVGLSADGKVGAENGTSEKFYAEFVRQGTNTDGSDMVPNWDFEQNVSVHLGSVHPYTDAKPMSLVHSLFWNSPQSLMITGRLTYGAGTNNANCIGFNDQASGSVSTDLTQRLAICLLAGGAYLVNGNATPTTLNSPVAGDTTVTMWVTQDSAHTGKYKIYTSLVHDGSANGVTNTFTNIDIPIMENGNNITNVEVGATSRANDFISNVRYAVGGWGPSEHFNMSWDGGFHISNLAVLATDMPGGVWAVIPPGYKPGMANKAVLYMHGLNEQAYSVSNAGFDVGINNVSYGLALAGYVVIGIGHTSLQGYGNPTYMTELAADVADISARLSLQSGFYVMGDSMGGFEILNALAHGTIPIRAVECFDCNTNLADDYFLNYTMPNGVQPAQTGSAGYYASQTPGSPPDFIDPAYGLSGPSAYAAGTAGYDPQLNAQTPGTALNYFIQTPMQLWSSYSDQAVNRIANTDLFASTVNAAGGNVQVQTCTGGHIDLSCFVPSAVVSFFNAN